LKHFFSSVILSIIIVAHAQAVFALPEKDFPAKACILINDRGQVLYEKNPYAKLPPASTVKLVTAMVALDYLQPSMTVKVTRTAASAPSIRPRLKPGDQLTVSDLLHLALMKSINAAAVALAEATCGSEEKFVLLMNQKAKEIGADDTYFVTASGLPKGKQFTTARDLTIILKKALTYPLIKDIIGKKEYLITASSGRQLFLENTDDLLWLRNNAIGGKTGFTRRARHCFVGAIDTGNGLMYAAVLGATSRSRLWECTTMLADFGSTYRPFVPIEELQASSRNHDGNLPPVHLLDRPYGAFLNPFFSIPIRPLLQ